MLKRFVQLTEIWLIQFPGEMCISKYQPYDNTSAVSIK